MHGETPTPNWPKDDPVVTEISAGLGLPVEEVAKIEIQAAERAGCTIAAMEQDTVTELRAEQAEGGGPLLAAAELCHATYDRPSSGGLGGDVGLSQF